MSLTTWFLRKAFKRSDDKRDAGLTTPPDIERRTISAMERMPNGSRWMCTAPKERRQSCR